MTPYWSTLQKATTCQDGEGQEEKRRQFQSEKAVFTELEFKVELEICFQILDPLFNFKSLSVLMALNET